MEKSFDCVFKELIISKLGRPSFYNKFYHNLLDSSFDGIDLSRFEGQEPGSINTEGKLITDCLVEFLHLNPSSIRLRALYMELIPQLVTFKGALPLEVRLLEVVDTHRRNFRLLLNNLEKSDQI